MAKKHYMIQYLYIYICEIIVFKMIYYNINS